MQEILFRYGFGLVLMGLAVMIGLSVPEAYWTFALVVVTGLSVYRVWRFYRANLFVISLGALGSFMTMYLVVWMSAEIKTVYAEELATALMIGDRIFL